MSGQLEAFCHACDDTFAVPGGGDPSSLVCPSCRSDFVEVVESTDASGVNNVSHGEAMSRISVVPAGTVAVRFSSFGDSSSGLTGVLGGDYNLTHMWDTIVPRLGELSQGLNIGDFSFESALDRIIDHLADAHQPVQTPADSRVVAALPRNKFSAVPPVDGVRAKDPSTAEGSGGCENDTCVVCHDDYKTDDVIVTLPCGHFFHDSCIAPWFQERNTCPVCRLALPLQHEDASDEQELTEEQGDFMDIDEPDEFHDSSSQQEASAMRNSFPIATTQESSSESVQHPVTDGNPGQDTEERGSVEGRGEDLRNRINGAQQELEVLQRRLSEQLSEHQRLRGQITELQTQRTHLHSQYYDQQDSTVRLDALSDRAESMLSRFAQRLRNALGRDGGGGNNNRETVPDVGVPPQSDSQQTRRELE
ncbi:hypothetical protein BSKO_08323 [Bryopsis sp. KO-2023]|nr:hypothetical protein BSKO_08323 [Bryopsis sp. KO-2023]